MGARTDFLMRAQARQPIPAIAPPVEVSPFDGVCPICGAGIDESDPRQWSRGLAAKGLPWSSNGRWVRCPASPKQFQWRLIPLADLCDWEGAWSSNDE